MAPTMRHALPPFWHIIKTTTMSSGMAVLAIVLELAYWVFE